MRSFAGDFGPEKTKRPLWGSNGVPAPPSTRPSEAPAGPCTHLPVPVPDFLRRCLAVNPLERATVHQLRTHDLVMVCVSQVAESSVKCSVLAIHMYVHPGLS